MIRKSLALALIGFAFVLAGEAQTPGARGEGRAFSMFFDSDGSYLGIQTEEVTKENFAKLGLREVRGVAIEKVMEGSPAEKAGLQAGDVIVAFNGEQVTSVRKLTRLLGEVAADHEVKLTVVRGGGEREVLATLAKRPMPKFNEGSFSMPQMPDMPRTPFPPTGEFPRMPRMEQMPMPPPGAPGAPEAFVWQMGSGRRIGVSVTPLTKQLSEHFGVTSGVMINEVRVDSPAGKAGLKAGDIIVEVDGKEVKSDGDLIRAIAEKKEGDITLAIVRDRNRQTVRVTPEAAKDGQNTFFTMPSMPGFETPTYFSSPIGFRGFSPSFVPSFRFPGFCL